MVQYTIQKYKSWPSGGEDTLFLCTKKQIQMLKKEKTYSKQLVAIAKAHAQRIITQKLGYDAINWV